MQVVINKCFLLNPEKSGADPFCCLKKRRRSVLLFKKTAQIRFVVFEKNAP